MLIRAFLALAAVTLTDAPATTTRRLAHELRELEDLARIRGALEPVVRGLEPTRRAILERLVESRGSVVPMASLLACLRPGSAAHRDRRRGAPSDAARMAHPVRARPGPGRARGPGDAPGQIEVEARRQVNILRTRLAGRFAIGETNHVFELLGSPRLRVAPEPETESLEVVLAAARRVATLAPDLESGHSGAEVAAAMRSFLALVELTTADHEDRLTQLDGEVQDVVRRVRIRLAVEPCARGLGAARRASLELLLASEGQATIGDSADDQFALNAGTVRDRLGALSISISNRVNALSVRNPDPGPALISAPGACGEPWSADRGKESRRGSTARIHSQNVQSCSRKVGAVMTLGTKEAPFKPTARQWSACQEELKDPYGAEADAAEERGDPLPELAGRFFAFGQMLKGRSSERRDPVDFARDALKLCVVAAYRLGDFEESIVSLTDASLNSTRMSVVRVPVGQTPGGTRIVFWAELHACDDAVRWRFELVDLELVDLRPDRDE